MTATQEAVVQLAHAVSRDGGEGHIDIALPASVMTSLRSDVAWIRRFDVATSPHSEALCLWGPCGVITLRTRTESP